MTATARRLLAAALAAGLVLSGCSSDSDSATDGSETPAAPTTPASSDTGGDDTGDSGGRGDEEGATGFEIPEEYLQRLADAGIELADVDFPPQPEGVPWPTDEWPRGTLDDPEKADALAAIIERAFSEYSDDQNAIDAVLVVQGGRIVGEGYHPDWDPKALHNSWSMAKSMTSAMVGILADEGRLNIWEPVNAPEWSDPDDPRRAITLEHLLHMSSGLQWTEEYFDGTSDVVNILGNQNDRAGYTASKPLEFEPGTVFEYSTGTTNVIAREIGNVVGFSERLTGWMRDALFGRIGIGEVEHALDVTGNVSGGSWYRMTAEDFARFGYLFLRGGTWDGERIVSQEWINFSWTPSPARPTDEGPTDYGAQWWIPRFRKGVYTANGFDGQRIAVVPDRDLVIVVLSFDRSGNYLRVLDELYDVFDVPRGEVG